MARKLLNALVPVGLFGLVFGVYLASPVVQSVDSRWSVPLATSIIREGDFDLDEYVLQSPGYNLQVQWIRGHAYSYFPLGTPLLAAPLAYLYGFINPAFMDDVDQYHEQAELFIASLMTALAVVLIYLVGRASLSVARSAALALIFAFATPAWSTASRALWQHGASLLMLTATLLILTVARKRPRLVQLAGVSLAFSFFVRPTNAISVAVLSVLVFLEYRKYFPGYLLGAALVAVPFLALNLKIYGSPLAAYYMPDRLGGGSTLLEALAGNLVSPSRGLLIFSPILLFAALGVAFKAMRRGLTGLDWSLLTILGLHWVAISAFPKWWGGWSYGPRFFSDVLPYAVYFLIPVLAWLGEQRAPAVVGVLFWIAAAVSVFIHYRGAVDRATFDWNALPVDVDAAPARVWDWLDPQFLRGAAWADGLLPPRVVVAPASVDLSAAAPGTGDQRVALRIRSARGTRFDWQGETSPGITLTPAHGQGTTDATLIATIDVSLLRAAVGTEPVMRIGARRSGSGVPWQSVVVPVNLAKEPMQRVFLPVVSNVAGGLSP
jgi:hypothetical protein